MITTLSKLDPTGGIKYSFEAIYVCGDCSHMKKTRETKIKTRIISFLVVLNNTPQ